MEPSDRQGKKREGRREEKRDWDKGGAAWVKLETCPFNMSNLAERILSSGERRWPPRWKAGSELSRRASRWCLILMLSFPRSVALMHNWCILGTLCSWSTIFICSQVELGSDGTLTHKVWVWILTWMLFKSSKIQKWKFNNFLTEPNLHDFVSSVEDTLNKIYTIDSNGVQHSSKCLVFVFRRKKERKKLQMRLLRTDLRPVYTKNNDYKENFINVHTSAR